MNKITMILGAFGFAGFYYAQALGAVPPTEASALGATLTPMGAEKAASPDGSIPEWKGGLKKDAGTVSAAGFLSDPYKGESPLFTITAQNFEKYKDKLTPGQMALFKRYPLSYKMVVFPTHRSAVVPDEILEATKKNSTQTKLISGGNGLESYEAGVPFPMPKNGLEVIWNHISRYRGGSFSREVVQATPSPTGDYSLVNFSEQLVSPRSLKDFNPDAQKNILFFYKQSVVAPARLAGNVILVHETIDQVKEPRMAWVYNSGQRRVRRSPQSAYDSPGTASDGLRTADNLDMYNGSPDHYDWQLVGKKEVYIPYNNYKLDSPDLKYSEIIKPGHINQDIVRYELHRVWHVTATLKSTERHIYSKRDLFIDEDSWQVVEADHYDGRGELWRVAEAFAEQLYHVQLPWYAAEALYDLSSGRYWVMGLKNEQKSAYDFSFRASSNDFSPGSLRLDGVR